MKNLTYIICFLAFLMFSYNLKAEDNIEKSINKRNHQLIQYDSINAQIFDSTWFNIRNLAQLQARLIKNDNLIINDYLPLSNKYNNLVISNKKVVAQLAVNEVELALKRKLLMWSIYGAAALLILFLLALVLFIIYLSKNGKFKTQIKELEKLQEEYKVQLKNLSTEESNNTKLSEVEASYNQVIAENKLRFERENNSLNEKLAGYQYNTEILKDDLLTLKQEKENLLSQIESLKSNSNNENTDVSQKFQEVLNSKDEEINQLKANLTDYQQKMETHESKNVSADNENADVSRKFQEIITFKDNEIIQLKTNLADYHQKIETYESKNDNSEIERLLKKIQDLENEIGYKESDINEKHNYEKSKFVDELNDLRKLLEDEKLYNQQLKKNSEDLNNDISVLKEELTVSKSDSKEEGHTVTENLPIDVQKLIKDIDSLKMENEEYKKILNEELEFRKDILKLIEDLKK